MRFRAGCRVALLLAFVLPAHAEDQGVPVIAAQGTVQVAFPPWDDAESPLLDTLARAQRD